MVAVADHPKQCSLDLDNYIECLHHKKEVYIWMTWLMEKTRVARIRQEWAKQQKSGRIPRDPKVEVAEEEGKQVAARLGFIEGSVKQDKTSK